MEPVDLSDNQMFTTTINLRIPENTSYTSPYWLSRKGSLGKYHVADSSMIGRPETPPGFTIDFELEINGYNLTLKRAVIHKYAKPDKGERTQPFDILPRATVRISEPVLIFADREAKPVIVTVKSQMDNLDATLALNVSEGWTVREQELPVKIAKKGEEKSFRFTLIPPDSENEGSISPELNVNGQTISKELVSIAYDHIPAQSVLLPSESRVVRLNIEKVGENVGYIAGAGDNIPESLEQIGYKVNSIDPATITRGSLDDYDAIVVGIRAYNVVEELKFKQGLLLDYVKDGGTLIVQYNTVWRNDLGIDNLAPYPLDLSRDRVTDENSEVTILAPSHPLMQIPNRITQADFKGWVQERGLYFPDGWDSSFTPLLAMNDEGEDPKKGSLLVAPYGEGYYIYTGLSFFRELPAGVPGAYKLFANMLSIGSNAPQNVNAVKG
jgi:hypothetical protein